MMLKTWLARSRRNPSNYKFDVVETNELALPSKAVIAYLSSALIVAQASPKMIRSELKMLADDAADIRLEVVEKYVAQQVLPDDHSVATLVGNFGEVLAANILMEFEGFWFPIYKLRYREKKDWAMRLTDLFCVFKKDGIVRPLVLYGEVKTNSNGRNLNLGVEGHDSLVKDDALQNPEVLRFLCTLLYDMGKQEEAEFLSKIRLGKLMYDKSYDLFLIHEKASWKEEILVRLDGHALDRRLSPFSVTVVAVDNLRTLIDDCYQKTSVVAMEMVNG